MRNRVIAPLVMLATISTLTACSVTSKTTPVIPTEKPTATVHVESSGGTVVITPTPESTGMVMTLTGMTEATGAIHMDSGTMTTSGTMSTGIPMTKTETVSYMSPAGEDKVEFTVTVDNGIITAASSKVLATNDASKYNQDNFSKNISAKAVGMAKKNFKLDTVGGASLTTAAFNQFVTSL